MFVLCFFGEIHNYNSEKNSSEKYEINIFNIVNITISTVKNSVKSINETGNLLTLV